jgi:multicomponent Na+:H+ antiporter subunit F
MLIEAVAPWVFGVLVLAALCAFVRLLIGPNLADRVVALDTIAALSVGVAALHAIQHGLTVFLDVATVLALIAFVSTVAFARYLERKVNP